MSNYTIFEHGKSYGAEDFEGFHKHKSGNDVLFVYQFMTIRDWPEHKVSHIAWLRGLYLDRVMTRIIAHRLGLCEDSLYKNYTPENFLVDITREHDITVYDDECVYTYISFNRRWPDEDEDDRVNFMTHTFSGLDEQQRSVLKEITNKLSLKDVDLEKTADYAFSNMDSDGQAVRDSIVKYGIENASFNYLYEGYFSDTDE